MPYVPVRYLLNILPHGLGHNRFLIPERINVVQNQFTGTLPDGLDKLSQIGEELRAHLVVRIDQFCISFRLPGCVD